MTSVNGRWIRKKRRLAIYSRDGFRCAYCGVDVWFTSIPYVAASLDHFRGRSNDSRNLLTTCIHCNSAKQGKTVRQWYAVLRAQGINTGALQQRVRRALARNL